MLPLPLDSVGLTVRVFEATEGSGTAAVVVREGRSERIMVFFNVLAPCPVARGGVLRRAFVPIDGPAAGLVVAV